MKTNSVLTIAVSVILLLLTINLSKAGADPSIPLPFQVRGKINLDGIDLDKNSANGIRIKVTDLNGLSYNPVAEDTDGLNDADMYQVDIPLYEPTSQPDGANPGDKATIQAIKNGTYLKVVTPVNGEITIGQSGTFVQIDLTLTTCSALNVPIQWKESDGGNGHWYAVMSFKGNWEAAKIDAESRTYQGMQGYLATITSAEENEFVLNELCPAVCFIGGYQINPDSAPDRSWTWVTDEPWWYTDWKVGEPNDFSTALAETYLQYWYYDQNGTWNDIHGNYQSNYIIEYGTPEIPTALPAIIQLLDD
jgi:hypothetical protein